MRTTSISQQAATVALGETRIEKYTPFLANVFDFFKLAFKSK